MQLLKNNVRIFFISLLFPLSIVFSATENFPVQALVGGDTTPPSVPGSLVAIGVATTQIDLTWASSTDNFLLGGYHVWRDDVQIATTTLPQYSDTGLTASTSYVYYVTAYDSSFNFSASSSVATGTTASIVVATSTPEGVEEQGTFFGSKKYSFDREILSLVVVPQRDSVLIRYETRNVLRTVVRWGEGSAYEAGSLIENSFKQNHQITISNLVPGTMYRYTLEGETGSGKTGTLYTGTFMTLPPEDVFPPDNVMNARVEKQEADIVLTWENPEDLDFEKVRIVYSDQFYPTDIADGLVVYEGKGEDFIDTERAKKGGSHYYTIFSYDTRGNISSGVVVALLIDAQGNSTGAPPDLGNPLQNEIALSLADIVFMQDGVTLLPVDDTITIDGSKQLHVSIPYDRVPEHLKTILVRVESPRDASYAFTFLLRINKEKSAYTSTIAPFGVSGRFPFVVTVFDYKTSQIGYTHGVLDSDIEDAVLHSGGQGKGVFFGTMIRYTYIPLLLLLVLALTLSGRRLMLHKW